MARKRPQEHDEAERAGEHVGSALSRGARMWFENQARVFEHMDEIGRCWLERRREALDAARHSFDEMRQADNMGDVLRIQQDWVMASMRRLATDFSEFSGALLAISQSAGRRVERTTEQMGQDWQQASRDALSAAGSKPNIRRR